MREFKLSKEERKAAEQWRLNKCGSVCFDELFSYFQLWLKKRRNNHEIKRGVQSISKMA